MENALVLGTFDGVHIGHRAVLDAADGFDITAVTFSYPPKITNKNNMLLTLPDERYKLLKDCGVKKIDVLDFSLVKDMSASDFLEKLKSDYSPKLISCGFNYRFGKGASGDCQLLKRFCDENGIILKIAQRIEKDGKTVSSTAIRECIMNGDINGANAMLSRRFSFTATVIDGDKRGRTLGFPTANQVYPDRLVRPKFGVYLSSVSVEGKTYRAISNIGMRPTFATENVTSETYIDGLSGDIYGKDMTVSLEDFIREEKKFESIDELKAAISNDIKYIKKGVRL